MLAEFRLWKKWNGSAWVSFKTCLYVVVSNFSSSPVFSAATWGFGTSINFSDCSQYPE